MCLAFGAGLSELSAQLIRQKYNNYYKFKEHLWQIYQMHYKLKKAPVFKTLGLIFINKRDIKVIIRKIKIFLKVFMKDIYQL